MTGGDRLLMLRAVRRQHHQCDACEVAARIFVAACATVTVWFILVVQFGG